MFWEDPENTVKSGNATADMVYHNLEWIITALGSTLVFIVFVMQVYRIPTGSMADTLRGAHFRLACEECGYPYEYNFSPEKYHVRENTVPKGKVPILDPVRCPSCGFTYQVGTHASDGKYYKTQGNKLVPVDLQSVYKGDQIFVLKSIYQFFEPNRWDVVVFKNPLEPGIHYIKRLIARPGETVEIRDGDIYINGLITHKPPAVQEELWMPVYCNDFQPKHPELRAYYGHIWKNPLQAANDSAWDLTLEQGTVFALESSDPGIHRIEYRSEWAGGFRATYSYDPPLFYNQMPVCSDLMIQFYPQLQAKSSLGTLLSKYGRRYEGWIHADGRMEILQVNSDGEKQFLAEMSFDPDTISGLERFRFANVDHQLILTYGNQCITHDLGRGPDDAGTNTGILPQVEILGAGSVRLAHIELYRDIHYLSEGRGILRAGPDDPFTLHEDEFFVCGDNSPFSADARMWDRPGLKNGGGTYRTGVVPRDYMVGKAFFVHWPGGYEAIPGFIRFIPFADGMKIIYGGTPEYN